MCKTLAETLGWVPPSERFAKTIERAQKFACDSGSQEILAGHFFSAVLEDLDAIHFLGRHAIPLERLEALRYSERQPQPERDVPRLPAPSYHNSRTAVPPLHLEIAASPAVRRIAGLASAIAERRSLAEVHGGIALEAILEDGRSEGAKTLKALHAEIAKKTGQRLAPLPGAEYESAMLLIQAPPKEQPKVPPAPRTHGLTPLEQVSWLKERIEFALERERPYRLLKELNALGEGDRAFPSLAAVQLRDEAQAGLATNPVFVVHRELQLANHAVEEANARVKFAALSVAEIRPDIFSGLLPLVAKATAAELTAGLEARKLERAAASRIEAQPCQAAAQQHCSIQVENKATSVSVVTASWSNFAISTEMPPQASASEEGTKKSTARFGWLKGSVAAARASAISFFF